MLVVCVDFILPARKVVHLLTDVLELSIDFFELPVGVILEGGCGRIQLVVEQCLGRSIDFADDFAFDAGQRGGKIVVAVTVSLHFASQAFRFMLASITRARSLSARVNSSSSVAHTVSTRGSLIAGHARIAGE